MDKRVITTVLISLAIMLLWQRFFAPPVKPPQKVAAQTANSAGTPTGTPNDTGVVPPTVPSAAANPATKPASPSTPKPPRVITALDQPKHYHATFTTYGAVPTELILLDPQYQPLNLIHRPEPYLPFTLQFPNSDFTIAPDDAWQLVSASNTEIVYTLEQDRVKLTKTYRFEPGHYRGTLHVTVENKTAQPLRHHVEMTMYGYQDPQKKSGGMFSPTLPITEATCQVGGKAQREKLDDLLKKPYEGDGAVQWVGVDEQFFLLALAVPPDHSERCRMSATADGTMGATVQMHEQTVAANAKLDYEMSFFAGPKLLSELDAVNVAGTNPKLGNAINYGWLEIIARPMLWVMRAIHGVVPNWGWAIILLTLVVRLITLYPTVQSTKAMKKMAGLKPEMDKLKAKFGEDKVGLNNATMALYKEHGVSPLGGCLPMLFQMPIFFALYSMLRNSVELYNAPFLGWIHSLTTPDPYFILPVATGALMFLQNKLMPNTTTDPSQKTMMTIMPVMMTAFFLFTPSGLSLYMFTSTLLGIGQQAVFRTPSTGMGM